jgi:hypothetical protein
VIKIALPRTQSDLVPVRLDLRIELVYLVILTAAATAAAPTATAAPTRSLFGIPLHIDDVRDIRSDIDPRRRGVEQVLRQPYDSPLQHFSRGPNVYQREVMQRYGLVCVPQPVQITHKRVNRNLRRVGLLQRLPRLLQQHFRVVDVAVLIVAPAVPPVAPI